MADATKIAARLDTTETLEEMLERHLREGIANCKALWEKAARNQRFAHSDDQWEYRSAPSSNANDTSRKAQRLSMNEIGPVLQTLSGREMMQRFERQYLPRNQAHARFAEVMTAIDKALMQQTDAEQVESAAFKDGPGIQGVSCIRFEYDTLEDERGRLKLTDFPIWQVMWPRSARQVNLADRPWHRAGMWMPASEVRMRWPEKWADIASLAGANSWASFEPGGSGSSRTPWAGMEGNRPLSEQPFYSWHENEMWVEYEEWRDTAEVYEVGVPVDPAMTYAQALAGPAADGQDALTSATMTGAELREHKLSHEAATGEKVPAKLIVPRPRLTYRYAYVIGGKVMETEEIPVKRFTFLFLTGFRWSKPDGTEWIALVDKLIDAQKWNNVLLSALIRNLQINPKGLLIYEQGMFRSKKEAFEQFTSPGGTIEVPRGKLSGGAPPYQYVAGGSSPYSNMVEPLLMMYRESIPRLAGFNPGALGQLGGDLRRISGEVVRSVQDAAMTSNAELFDSLRHYRRDAGRLVLAFLAAFWADRPEELVEVVGEETVMREELDPMTQQPVQVNAMPPAEMWRADAWKMIAVEETVPTGDMLESLWDSMEQGVFQIVQTPQADTGQPLFSSEDLARMIPRIPAPMREKMIQRIMGAVQAMQQQQMMGAGAPEQAGQQAA